MSGKYQHTDDLDELIKTWKPEMMLHVPLRTHGRRTYHRWHGARDEIAMGTFIAIEGGDGVGKSDSFQTASRTHG
jgi:hypothetical protein